MTRAKSAETKRLASEVSVAQSIAHFLKFTPQEVLEAAKPAELPIKKAAQEDDEDDENEEEDEDDDDGEEDDAKEDDRLLELRRLTKEEDDENEEDWIGRYVPSDEEEEGNGVRKKSVEVEEDEEEEEGEEERKPKGRRALRMDKKRALASAAASQTNHPVNVSKGVAVPLPAHPKTLPPPLSKKLPPPPSSKRNSISIHGSALQAQTALPLTSVSKASVSVLSEKTRKKEEEAGGIIDRSKATVAPPSSAGKPVSGGGDASAMEKAPKRPLPPAFIPQNPAACIYVGNLPLDSTESQMSKLLAPFGALKCFHFEKSNNGKPAGFGYAEFSLPKSAAAAVACGGGGGGGGVAAGGSKQQGGGTAPLTLGGRDLRCTAYTTEVNYRNPDGSRRKQKKSKQQPLKRPMEEEPDSHGKNKIRRVANSY